MDKMKNGELVVRKVTTAFIEKVFRFCGYEFNHDDLKATLYGEKEYNCKTIEKIKHYYDGYIFLLENRMNPVTYSLLNRFHFILKEEYLDHTLGNKIVEKFFTLNNDDPIAKAIEFHLFVRSGLNNYDKLDQVIIPLMMLNFILVKGNIPTIKLVYLNLIKYQNTLLDNDTSFLYEFIKDYDYVSKKYMMKLKPLTLNKIKNTFLKDKEKLINDYHVKELMIYGSFAKGNYRIDSDIDVIVKISQDVSYKERVEIIQYIKEYYTKKFNRFIDIQEIDAVISDEFIKEVTKKIFIF